MADRKNIMDVSKPGKSAATATAKPVIVGHGAMIKDPMVKDTDSATDTPAAEPEHLEVRHEKVILQPSAAMSKEDKPVDATSPEAEPEKDTAKEPEAKDASEESPAKTTDNNDDLGSEEAIVDAVAGQAGKKSKAQSDKDNAQKELIEKLIREKTYNLPIKQTAAKRSGRWLMVVMVVALVALLAGYAAVDAGVVKPGFDVPYHLIGQSKSEDTANDQPLPTTPTVTTTGTSTQKTYNDTAKLYTLKYPSTWKLLPAADGNDSGRVIDYTKQSRTILLAKSLAGTIDAKAVTVQASTDATLGNQFRTNWKENNHPSTKETVNGVTIEHALIIFKGDAESYTDDNYLVTKGKTTVAVTFRQKYFHQSPAENWDQSDQATTVANLVKSITIN